MPGPLSADQPVGNEDRMRSDAPGQAAPPPSWLEAAGASWRLNEDDGQEAQVLYQLQGYGTLADTLMKRGYPGQRYGVTGPKQASWIDNLPGTPGNGGTEVSGRFQDQVWGDVEAERKKAQAQGQPDPFPGIPATRAEFNVFAAQRMGARGKDQDMSSRGGLGTSLVPGAGFGILHATDPENLLQIPMGGGGRTVAGILTRQFVAGAAGTVLTTPERVLSRSQMGEGYTIGDLTSDAVFGGLGNAGKRGAEAEYKDSPTNRQNDGSGWDR